MAKDTIIILPTFNERENIQKIIPEIFSCLPEVNILVVDDNSPDGTGEVVTELMKEYPQVRLYTREKKEGLGVAYRAAISHIQETQDFQFIITMDADGSHDPMYLQHMIDALAEHDVVVASRYVQGGGIEKWEKWRYMLSKYGNLYANICTGMSVRDLTAGYIGFSTAILPRMKFENLSASGYAYQMEFKFHARYYAKARMHEVPIIFKNRREGESKISRHIIREGIMTPPRLLIRRITDFIYE